MSKEAAQLAAILKNWGPTLQRAVTKANSNRFPAGAPASKGGQFAPGKGGGTAPFSTSKLGFKHGQMSLFSGMQEGVNAPQYGMKKPVMAGATKWYAPGSNVMGDGPEAPKPPPPGWKPHTKVDDKGNPVTINYPTKPSDPSTWHNPDATATFTPGGAAPTKLNGVTMKPWTDAPQRLHEWATVSGQRPELDANFPIEPKPGKSVGAGVIVVEPDGRMWLTKPTNHFGGYMQTFPKGTVEHGLSLQASAIKEAYEETGLKVEITGILGDYERTTSVARFYIARRVGGTPADMGWESQALRLSPQRDLGKLLNMNVDKDILADYREEHFLKRAPLSLLRDHAVADQEATRRGLDWLYKAGGKAQEGAKGGHWQHQERWPGGTPLGGQWKTMGVDGLTMPPTLAGGLAGKNVAYQKKANAAHAAAQAGNLTAVMDQAILLEKAVLAAKAAGQKSSHVKWNAQLSQYVSALTADMVAKPKAEAAADKIMGPEKLSAFTKVGEKPGGSNDGAIYTDAQGTKWLVKGNNYASTGGLAMSDDRAKNEVLASKLMAAAGIPGPEIKLVDLEGKHQGNLGVAVKWIDGLQKFNATDAGQLAAVQIQFAVHAFLGNWDVLGMSLDNTMFKDGRAINIDPGGSILFRAQGAPKAPGAFGANANDFTSMLSTDQHQKSVYGKMTASQLQESAKQLANLSDDTIAKLVGAYGPGGVKEKSDLTDTLIARRDAIMLKAGLTVNMKMGASLVQAEPTPPPEPPKIVEAVKAPADTPVPVGIAKPVFDGIVPSTSTKNPNTYYTGLVDKAEALHKSGDLAGLKAMVDAKKNPGTWGNQTFNSKKLVAYHAALVADLEGKKQTAVNAVADGKATVTDAKGQAWKADKGVINPVPAPAKELDVSLLDEANDIIPYTSGVSAKQGNANMLADQMAQAYAAKDAKALSEMENQIGNFQASSQISDGDAKALYAAHKKLSDKMNGVAPAPAKPSGKALRGQTAVQADPAPAKPDTIPGFSAAFAEPPPPAPKPPLPDFEKAKLPLSNTNAPSHNKKVEQIKALAEKGDVAAILSLKFSTNTMGKKQVPLANDVLAALGSPHKVTAGQAANSHPALVGGAGQPGTPPTPAMTAAAASPPPAAAAAPAAPAAPVFKIPNPPDFQNWNGPGAGLSGVQALNAANNELAKEIYETGQKLDLAALADFKFKEVDKATGLPTGNMLPISQHKSQHIVAYFKDVLDGVKNPYVPPPVMSADQLAAIPDKVKAIATAFADVKALGAAKSRAGRYAIMGQVEGKPFDGFPPVTLSQNAGNAPTKDLYKQSMDNFKKLSAVEQQAIKDYTGGGYKGMNASIKDDNPNDKAGKAISGLKKASVTLPSGLVLSRKFTFPDSASLKSFLGSVGTVVKEFGIVSTSTNPAVWSGDVHLKITTAPGAKGLYVDGAHGPPISLNSGEHEIILPFGSKYYVKSVTKAHKDESGSWGAHSTHIVELVLLPDLD